MIVTMVLVNISVHNITTTNNKYIQFNIYIYNIYIIFLKSNYKNYIYIYFRIVHNNNNKNRLSDRKRQSETT